MTKNLNILFQIFLFIFYFSCNQAPPKDLGIKDISGKKVLRNCFQSSDCISSYAKDKSLFLEPLRYKTMKNDAYKLLLEVLNRDSNGTIVSKNENYIHITYKNFLGFIDDIEFSFHQEGLINFTASSRKSIPLFSSNRKRLSQITFYFYQNNL